MLRFFNNDPKFNRYDNFRVEVGLHSTSFKGSDWLCKVVELSIQYCRKLLAASFDTYKTFERSVNSEFERKVDVQNS